MALVKCHECGANVSTEAAACPGCGARPRSSDAPAVAASFKCESCGRDVPAQAPFCPNCYAKPKSDLERKLTRPVQSADFLYSREARWTAGLLLALLLTVVFSSWRHSSPSDSPTEVTTAAQGAPQTSGPVLQPPPLPDLPTPQVEADLRDIVETAQTEAKGADNDMQLGAVKARRDRAVCQKVRSLSAKDWIGVVETLDSNSDGKGVLGVQIAPDVVLKTWNNSFSDIGDNTLLEPDSRVFQAAMNMKKGQRVVFSGAFFKGDDSECIKESSLTLRGKVLEPEFIFRFSDIGDYEEVAKADTQRGKTDMARH